jgi:hypothetical protein
LSKIIEIIYGSEYGKKWSKTVENNRELDCHVWKKFENCLQIGENWFITQDSWVGNG